MFLSKYWAIVCRLMPSTIYLKWQYYHVYHKNLNIGHPKTYAEKLAYLKVHKYDPRLESLVDKYQVREYISRIIGDEYSVPLIGVYNNCDEIPWDRLPDRYVLKCTHDSGSTVICRDSTFNQDKAIRKLKKSLGQNLYWASREYPYRNLRPRIICETYLDDNGHPPYDYKILCFSGKPHYIIVDIDRFEDHHRDCYNTQWEKIDFGTDHEQSNTIISKPQCLDSMLELAEKLSKGFAHVRVDFYILNNKIYFGELTFFPWGGLIWFKPDSLNFELGDMIDLDYHV